MHRNRLRRDGAERLGQIDGVRELSLGQRRELAHLADEVTASAGETIMRQGEPGFEFMMLEEGTAEVVQDGEGINVMQAGDFFGELAVLSDGGARTASVVATSDIRAIVLTAHFMREMRQRMPPAGERIDEVATSRTESDRARSGP
jgi:CRP-like cAMP-binding protein